MTFFFPSLAFLRQNHLVYLSACLSISIYLSRGSQEVVGLSFVQKVTKISVLCIWNNQVNCFHISAFDGSSVFHFSSFSFSFYHPLSLLCGITTRTTVTETASQEKEKEKFYVRVHFVENSITAINECNELNLLAMRERNGHSKKKWNCNQIHLKIKWNEVIERNATKTHRWSPFPLPLLFLYVFHLFAASLLHLQQQQQ